MRVQYVLVTTMLGLWAVICLSLVRAAERRVIGRRAPFSWFAFSAALVVAFAAPLCRATPAIGVACGLACIALIAGGDGDRRTGYLFDAVTLPAAILTVCAAIVDGTTLDATYGVMLIVGPFAGIVAMSHGRSMGLGDVKAMFALGAAFGPFQSLVAIFFACLCGIATAALSQRMRRGARIHFGPHLAAGGSFALIAGDPIVHRILGL